MEIQKKGLSLSEYQKLTSRTNTDLGSDAINAAHVTLGIVGETGEFRTAIDNASLERWRKNNVSDDLKLQVKLEGGDACWYISELANIFDLELVPLDYYDSEKSVEWIAEVIKKFLAYNKPVDTIDLQKRLESVLWDIHIGLEQWGFTLEECLHDNIEKLRKRFPEKFDANLAIQQNDMK